MGTIKVAVVDDHEVLREGVKSIISNNDDIEILMEAGNGKEFIDLLESSTTMPDIVLLDVEMPVMGGIETIKVLSENFPEIKILILTMHTDENIKQQLMDLKVNGFVHKHTGSAILEEAIYALSENDNRRFLDPVIAQEMQEWWANRNKIQVHPDDELTDREKEVLVLICYEYTTPQIAKTLKLTKDTVKTYRKRLFDKIGCKNMTGLVAYAILNKLVNAEDIVRSKGTTRKR